MMHGQKNITLFLFQFILKSVFNVLFSIHILPEYHFGTVLGVMYVQHSKVNYAAPTGSFLLFCKEEELVTGRNMIEILPEILETKEFLSRSSEYGIK